MARPKAYDPQDGYKYQLLCRHPQYNGREWEHCDYAVDRADKKHLLENYRQAYGAGYEFQSILLPEKYWPKAKPEPKAKWESTAVATREEVMAILNQPREVTEG